MKRSTLLALAALLSVSTCSIGSADGAKAKPNPQLYLHLSTDRADASYAVGEPVTWTIKVTGVKPDEPPITPAFSVVSGKTALTNGTLRFVDGMAKVTGKLDHPGIIEIQVNQSTPWRTGFRCGAAVALSEIKSTVPEPADFDAFWKKKLFLSCSRAVDYLAGRGDWNKSALLVQGGSQGGFQGLAVAALNPKVTALTVFVPGGCDLTGFLEGRPNGWPGWVGSRATGADREARIRTAGYYDANNFAKRIKCPVLVGTGLLDTIAPPITQFTMYNNIAASKRLVLMPEDEHTSPHTAYKAAQNVWWQAAAAGEPLPMK